MEPHAQPPEARPTIGAVETTRSRRPAGPSRPSRARGAARAVACLVPLLALLPAACRTAGRAPGALGASGPPPPLPLHLALEHRPGGPLELPPAGGAEGRAEPDPASCLRVRASLHVGPALGEPLPLLASRAELVLALQGEDPVRPAPDVEVGVGLDAGEAARAAAEELRRPPFREVASVRGVLAPASAAVVRGWSDGWRSSAGEVMRRRVGLHLVRRDGPGGAGEPLELVVQIDTLAPAEPGPPLQAPPEPPPLDSELVFVDLPISVGGPPLVALVPFPRRLGAGVLGLVVSVEPAPAAGDADFELHAADVRRAARELLRPLELAVLPLPSSEEADERRAPLVAFALAAEASFAGDVALVADGALLDELARAIAPGGPGGPGGPVGSGATGSTGGRSEGAPAGWRLERAAWRAVLGRSLRGSLDPPLVGVYVRHAGEMARFPDLVERIVLSSPDGATVSRRLVEANVERLRDGDPGVRLRADAWLSERGAGPPDFDPLAGPRERRAALAAWRAPLEKRGNGNGGDGGGEGR